ncbi:MAG: curli assembly protein CsgF [Pseudomonadota bacterium]
MIKIVFAIFLSSLVFSASISNASPLTYTPVNPDFGGNPFNGSYLLSNASANNHYVAPQNSTSSALDSLVTTSVLSSVSANISNKILNSTNGQSGTFNTGTDTISYVNNGGTVTMTVFNNATGKTTILTFPAGV